MEALLFYARMEGIVPFTDNHYMNDSFKKIFCKPDSINITLDPFKDKTKTSPLN